MHVVIHDVHVVKFTLSTRIFLSEFRLIKVNLRRNFNPIEKVRDCCLRLSGLPGFGLFSSFGEKISK